MKKIKYSVSEHTVKWGAKAGEKRYTANLQTTGVMSLDDFAGHMADHDCKYNKGDIYSVLTQAANCVREMLLEGNKVSLGDLGVISPKIKQRAAKSRDEFSSSNIFLFLLDTAIKPFICFIRLRTSFISLNSKVQSVLSPTAQ